MNKITPGDKFQDNDKRHPSPRIVRVEREIRSAFGTAWQVEVVEHWDEKLIGRRTVIRERRLLADNAHGYSRVSH